MAAVQIGYLSADTLTNIGDAIRRKNGESTKYAPSQMDTAIDAIVTLSEGSADATASAEDILTGKTAYVNGVKVTGTRPESTGGVDTSDATAEAGDIAEGKTAYINGGKVTGTMAVISCYSGDTEPSNALGNDGDIYILISDAEETPATAGSISTTNNSISLSDDLPSDTYTLKYEDASGNPISEWAEIGTVTK